MPITKLSLDVNAKDEVGDSITVGWAAADERLPVSLADRSTGDEVTVSSGRLNVATPPPEAPAGTTAIDVSNTASADATTFYTITSGEDLTIQQFTGGAQGGKQSKIELWYDPDGTYPSGTSVLLSKGYASGNNFQFDLNDTYTGDGTARIALFLDRIDGGAVEMFGQFTGFETTP